MECYSQYLPFPVTWKFQGSIVCFGLNVLGMFVLAVLCHPVIYDHLYLLHRF